MGAVPRNSDGRRLFNTEFKRTTTVAVASVNRHPTIGVKTQRATGVGP